MKTLKSTLAAIIILFTSVAVSNAAVKPGQPSQSDVVNIYINAVSNGRATDIDKYFDDELQFNVHHGNNITTLDKRQVLDFLQQSTGSNAPVNTNTTVMQQDDNSAKIKVVFKYGDYTRTDVVTLNKAFGWKITDVESTSK
jgi:hypothetical protein